MSYKFTCENCGHSWEVAYMGNYPISFVTNNPCIKCDTKSITAKKIESEIKVESTQKSPTVIYKTSKKPSRDFINHIENIKRTHPNSTIQI